MRTTVIEYVLARLRDIGVTDIFGVPGDYSFPVNDAIVKDPEIRWVGCCNELNGAFAADGYARVKGVAALNTTYGVGELSAINGMAGAYAEHLPVFHLVGMPSMPAQAGHTVTHHTLGDGEFGVFRRMSEPVVCGSAIMTPQNVAYETERLIAEAVHHRRPVYMAFPADMANQPVVSSARHLDPPASDPASLERAADAIVAALDNAASACILPGILVLRAGLRWALRGLVNASGIPFSTMFMDKSVLDEQHPSYIGMYDGTLMDETVRHFVETCDCVLTVGTLMSDFNSGAFTARLSPAKTINIRHHHVEVASKVFPNIEMGDMLTALSKRLSKHRKWPTIEASSLGPTVGRGSDPITAAALYPRWEQFLRPNDIIMAETGTASMGLAFALLPKGADFHNQTLWGSIGWAMPAAFGAAVAAPERRVVVVTGDGSLQVTVQEMSQFGRLGLKPIIFVLNNSGYLIERLLARDPGMAYNDIAPWNYTDLPRALGCEGWLTASATTCGELDRALEAAGRADSGAYIEVVTDTYAASPLSLKLHESVSSLYHS